MLEGASLCWYGCTVSDDDFEPWAWDDSGYEINFATQMRERREAKGWSQTEFARRLSEGGLRFHQTTVQRVEAGERPLKLTEALVIARVLDARFETMLRGESVEIAYNELAEMVAADAFDFLVRQAETIDSHVKRGTENGNQLIASYVRAVSTVPGLEPDKRLIKVAREYVRLNTELQEDAHSLATLIRTAARVFAKLDREYPIEYAGPTS